jgi:hypothetical protein
MPLDKRVVEVYRRDEKYGHKLLNPDERRRLIEVRVFRCFWLRFLLTYAIVPAIPTGS